MVQLKKPSRSAFREEHELPTWNKSILHLVDFVVYRVTKRTRVGPPLGALRGHRASSRKCALLAAAFMTTLHYRGRRLPSGCSPATLAQLDAEDQVVQDKSLTHSDLVRRFLGPLREDPLVELKPGPGRGRGRGLFGNSQVWVSESPASTAHRLLSAEVHPDGWALPNVVAARPIEIEVGDRRVRLAARVPANAQEES